jgi:hypothetical protein
MRSVNHDGVGLCPASYQAAEYSIKDAHSRPTDEAIVEGLVRSINFRRVPPSQAVSDDMYYSADYSPVIDTRLAMGSWEARLDARKQGFR